MRGLSIAVYIVILFCLTCSEDFYVLMTKYELKFKWISRPDFRLFFNFTEYPFSSPYYIGQKAGHAFCFFWLAFSFSWVFKRLFPVFLFSVGYALFTEVAQLFFSRTGCLLDICYDSAGVLFFVTIRKILQYIKLRKQVCRPRENILEEV